MRSAPTSRTSILPPPLSSFPQEREQLEFSSRSLVFAPDGRRILRVWGPPSRPWVLGIEPAGTRWGVTAWGAGPKEARAAVRALFSLDHPVEEFYGLARSDPVLRAAARRFRGLRLPRDPHLYEALVHSILGQQLSVAAASTIKRRLVDATGSYREVDGVQVAHLPSPRAMRLLGFDGLRRVGASGAKARALLALAETEPRGTLNESNFTSRPTSEVVERLDELPGVGPWTAESATMRGLGRTDVFVAGDLGLRAALDRYGVLPRTAPEADARAWADRTYPGWGSYATLYLWRQLVADLKDAEG